LRMVKKPRRDCKVSEQKTVARKKGPMREKAKGRGRIWSMPTGKNVATDEIGHERKSRYW